jgi:hypothetical protein
VIDDFRFYPVVVVGTGPSLSNEQCNQIMQRRRENCCRVIVVNNAYRYVRNADALYAADFNWWKEHDGLIANIDKKPGINALCPAIARFCPEPAAIRAYKTQMVRIDAGSRGIAPEGKGVRRGSGSGFQAVGLAILLGAKRIVLVGMDCKRGPKGEIHVHGEHKHPLRNDQPLNTWKEEFDSLEGDSAALGIDIANCTIDTAIHRIRRSTLERELFHHD